MKRARVAIAIALVSTAIAVGGVEASDEPMATLPSGTPAAATGDALLDAAAPIALAAVQSAPGLVGGTSDDVADLVVTDTVPLGGSEATVVYLQQRIDGISVRDAISPVAVDAAGVVVGMSDRVVDGARQRIVGGTTPVLRPAQAATEALAAVGLQPTEPVVVTDKPTGPARQTELTDGGVADAPIPAELQYVQTADGALHLAWSVQVDSSVTQDVWQVQIDATTGEEIGRVNLVVHDRFVDAAAAPARRTTSAAGATPAGTAGSGLTGGAAVTVPRAAAVADGSSYTVFDLPVESPTFAATPGVRTTIQQPADDTASPFGWHDIDADVAPEFTTTTGNNVDAFTDLDDDDQPDPGGRPNGGAGLDFSFPLNLAKQPSTYRTAAVTNLFVATNRIHDILYHYGFDERSGNFQYHNYGRGGQAKDPVLAHAQDGNAQDDNHVNNANFYTPPDGYPPTMQMYLWNESSPMLDGDLDNGIIVHEFGHGVSTRLTGGPSAASCLANDEQMGEGWSDALTMLLTMNPAKPLPARRGMGTYVLGEPTTGKGIRMYRYSADLDKDPRVYDDLKTPPYDVGEWGPHPLGSLWAAMLWQLTVALTEEHGYDADMIAGTGGNNLALQLILDGLKLQPSAPGFVDGRDAILLADRLATGGANQCLIWRAFAARGLGATAKQGSQYSSTDGTQSFAVPASCDGITVAVALPAQARSNGAARLQVSGTNEGDTPVGGVVLRATLPSGFSLKPGTATCPGGITGTVVNGSLRFVVGTLDGGETVTCSARLTGDTAKWTTNVWKDGFENGLGGWRRSSTLAGAEWTTTAAQHAGGSRSAVVKDYPKTSVTALSKRGAFRATSRTQLLFTHLYLTEEGWDGGVVEVSTDGGSTWRDAGSRMDGRRYTMGLGTYCPAPGFGRNRPAFSGYGISFGTTTVDLAAFKGKDVLVRFVMATDCENGEGSPAKAWWVDDVTVRNTVTVSTVASAAGSGVPTTKAKASTLILAPS